MREEGIPYEKKNNRSKKLCYIFYRSISSDHIYYHMAFVSHKNNNNTRHILVSASYETEYSNLSSKYQNTIHKNASRLSAILARHLSFLPVCDLRQRWIFWNLKYQIMNRYDFFFVTASSQTAPAVFFSEDK